MWPSGLRRVTRNHFPYGSVGSNPATVVYKFLVYKFLVYNKEYKKQDKV